MEDKMDIKVVEHGSGPRPSEIAVDVDEEKARLAALPRATEIPVTDEAGTFSIEFEHEGMLHIVEMRNPTYSRQKALSKGMKTVTWEEPYKDDDGFERTRVYTERDDYAFANLIDRVFETWVLTINGRSWVYSLPAMATLGGKHPERWLSAFGVAFQKETGIGEVLDDSRKK